MAVLDDDLQEDRARGCEVHKAFRRDRSMGPVFLGQFYRQNLKACIWPSQTAMAKAFSISVSHVSRCIAISELSKEVVAAFGGEQYISFRLGDTLLRLSRSLGADEISRRAVKAKGLNLVTPGDVMQMLVTGASPVRKTPRLWVSVERGGKALRIEGPDAERLIGNIDELEDAIRDCLATLDEENGLRAETGLYLTIRRRYRRS